MRPSAMSTASMLPALPTVSTLSTPSPSAPSAPSALSASTLAVPSGIEWQPLQCPVCGEALAADRDGTSCAGCRGLLVQRAWADRLMPALGRPSLPPVFQSAPRVLGCPGCKKAMGPVLCHGVAAWSCAGCRWLFIEGPRKEALMHPNAITATPAPRVLAQATLLCVASEGARRAARGASPKLLDALGILVLVALIVAVVVMEARG